MINAPKTLEEAKKTKYGFRGDWIYVVGRCAYKVWSHGSVAAYQCAKSAKHGPANLYCKQHAKMVK